MTALAELRIVAETAPWRAAGFTVDDDGVLDIGTVRIRLGLDASSPVPGPPGLRSWTLGGAPDQTVVDVDGLPTRHLRPADVGGSPPSSAIAVARSGDMSASAPDPSPTHSIGAVAIDHLVVVTPDLPRTVAAIERDLGLTLRRTRESGTSGQPMRQAFFRIGEPILEVVGPQELEPGGGPARFYGIALTVTELDSALERLGDRIGDAKPAVQPRRHIATIRRTAGSSLPVALMTPDR